MIRLARLGVVLLLVSMALASASAAPVPQAGKRDDGLAPARALSPVDRARLAAKAPQTLAAAQYQDMSPMGALAAGLVPAPAAEDARAAAPAPGRPGRMASPLAIGASDVIVHGAGGDIAGQAETSIAANASGTILIAGYNEARGFSTSPVSLSGVARSGDGGQTWGEVPVGPGGAGTLPGVAGGQVFGDPDVKYDPTRDLFVYASIYVRPSDSVQGMSIHYSNSGASAGTQWTGPIEVAPSFIAGESADKEFIDINPVTGRLMITWTQFSASPARILRSYSDDLGQTWAPAVTLSQAASGGGVQASMPRFKPGTSNADSNVYAVWRTSAPTTGNRNIGFARSLDGGATWSSAANITTDYSPEDQILGIDRINTSPSMAVDYASGNIYIVYQANNSVGEGDIAFQRSTDGGASFSARVLIDSNPGLDRAQFYPWVTVDQSTHRVHAIWYDQDPDPSGDVTELMHTYSDDAGATWSRPTPLFDHSFHAGYGNDTSQPNLGDYNQTVAISGTLHTVAAGASVLPRYDEGQPSSASMVTPDTYYDQLAATTQVAALRLGAVTFTESNCAAGANGALDPGEIAGITFPLENYVANPNSSPTTYTGVTGHLSTSTPGVTVLDADQAYPNIAQLATISNAAPFRIQLSKAFVPGTSVDLMLAVSTGQGSIQLPYRMSTGSDGAVTSLINQNFDGTVAPALPTGWTASNGGGAAADPWVTGSALTASNAAYHDETAVTMFARLLSPTVTVPSPGAGVESYVTLDFDLVYDLEEEPTQSIMAYDGLTLRITDQTSGATVRSVLAEAFAEAIATGNSKHFPKHLPRSSNTSYFQDMSVWSGSSNGTVHIHMKFAGQGIVGRSIQLRFEYTQDGVATCADLGRGPCGVAVDNVQLKQIQSTNSQCHADLALTKTVSPTTALPGQPITYTLAYANAGPNAATGVSIDDLLPSQLTSISYLSSGAAITPTASPSYTWQVADLAPGAGGLITITGVLSATVPRGVITNTATITATTPEDAPANNRSAAALTIQNAPPTAADDTYSTPPGTLLTVGAAAGVLANDIDANGDPLTAQQVAAPPTGTLTLQSNGSFTYQPGVGASGGVTFTYQAGDGLATSGTATVTITINTPPTISDIPDQLTNVNTPLGPLAFTVGDVDAGDVLTVTAASSNSALVPNANIALGGSGTSRTITITPAAGQTGQTTISVIVGDGHGGSATDTFVLTVEQHTVYLPIVRR